MKGEDDVKVVEIDLIITFPLSKFSYISLWHYNEVMYVL